jgi:hypothetical protein
MDDFHVPDLLVQLLLLECWTGGLSLLASSLSERERVSWFVSSGCSAAAPGAEAFFGGMTKVRACQRWSNEFTGGGRQCWGLVLKCFGLTEGESTSVTHKRVQINVNSTGVLFIYL